MFLLDNMIGILYIRVKLSLKTSSLQILEICSQNDYQYISNFEWYVSVLVELSQVKASSNNKYIHMLVEMFIRLNKCAIRSISITAVFLSLNLVVLFATIDKSF